MTERKTETGNAGAVELTEEALALASGGNTAKSCKWLVADSFSFGVEREMKESGE